MGKVTVIINKYDFIKPQILSEAEFISYKQIFQVEPNYIMSPQNGFWEEFFVEKWLIVGVFGGMLLGLKWEAFLFFSGISIFLLIFSILSGSAQSMWNYLSFLNEKNKYYEGLKQAIINSNNYDEFKLKVSKI